MKKLPITVPSGTDLAFAFFKKATTALFMVIFFVIFATSCSKNADNITPITDLNNTVKTQPLKLVESNFTFDIQAYFIGKRIDDQTIEYLYDFKSMGAASCTEEFTLITRSLRIKVKPIIKTTTNIEGIPIHIEYFPEEFDVFIDNAFFNEVFYKKAKFLIITTKKSNIGSKCLQSYFVKDGIPIY